MLEAMEISVISLHFQGTSTLRFSHERCGLICMDMVLIPWKYWKTCKIPKSKQINRDVYHNTVLFKKKWELEWTMSTCNNINE